MNEIIEKENILIEDMIYKVRGVQVMLDRDLAKLYQCTNGTKDINKAVKRNIELSIVGETCTIYGVRRYIYEIRDNRSIC